MLAMLVVSAPGFEACMQPQMTRHSVRRSQGYMDLEFAHWGSGFRGCRLLCSKVQGTHSATDLALLKAVYRNIGPDLGNYMT